MKQTGIILYGPPGSGKDTVTAELCRLRPEYRLFPRLKAGPGRSTGYRLTTPEHIEQLASRDQLLYSNARYNATYAIDKDEISNQFKAGVIPILHMGQVAGIEAVEAYPAHWLQVLLWCPRLVTEERCIARGDTDLAARLTAWDETQQDLSGNTNSTWSLIIETHRCPPAATAKMIDDAATSGTSAATCLPSRIVS